SGAARYRHWRHPYAAASAHAKRSAVYPSLGGTRRASATHFPTDLTWQTQDAQQLAESPVLGQGQWWLDTLTGSNHAIVGFASRGNRPPFSGPQAPSCPNTTAALISSEGIRSLLSACGLSLRSGRSLRALAACLAEDAIPIGHRADDDRAHQEERGPCDGEARLAKPQGVIGGPHSGAARGGSPRDGE